MNYVVEMNSGGRRVSKGEEWVKRITRMSKIDFHE